MRAPSSVSLLAGLALEGPFPRIFQQQASQRVVLRNGFGGDTHVIADGVSSARL